MQSWPRNERVWAHPPPDLLDDLAELLARPERKSEVSCLVEDRDGQLTPM